MVEEGCACTKVGRRRLKQAGCQGERGSLRVIGELPPMTSIACLFVGARYWNERVLTLPDLAQARSLSLSGRLFGRSCFDAPLRELYGLGNARARRDPVTYFRGCLPRVRKISA